MPISSHALLPYVIQEMELVKPEYILDLGIGHGIYGALIWNYGEILCGSIPRIHGVEAWEDYECPMWEVYEHVYRVRLQDYTSTVKYDMIIMMDVIEHLSLKEGHQELERYKGMLSPNGVMIVSTPGVFVRQDAYKGNIFEEHKCLWTPEKFKMHDFVPARNPKSTLFGEFMLIYKYKKQED
jgi:hypothetical protein